ncbi:MAG: hypothetical protein SGILL_006514, partial [Bacillariaceae sp.]
MTDNTDGKNDDGANPSSKLGRKGDPRMHKAVATRLENPSLSLYEALCIGGFEYADNDDASQMDSEKVTLGQRKNQLSRRLRLAKKQSNDNTQHTDYATSAGAAGQNRSAFGARALQMKRDGDLLESDFVSVDGGSDQMDEHNKRPRIAKNHPDFAPLIVPPASFRGAGNLDTTSLIHQTSFGSNSYQCQNPANPTYGASGNMMGPMGGSAMTS